MSAISKMKSLLTQTPWPKLSSSSSSPSHFLPSMASKLTVLRNLQSPLFNPNLLRLKPTLSLRRSSLCSVQSRGLQTESVTRPVSGEIHVIVGPMFAGKTTTLLRRVQSERSNGRFQVKPRINNLRADKTLRALCISGRLQEAVSLLYRNRAQLNPKTYELLLQECIFTKDHRSGNRIHAQMIMSGFVPDEYLKTKLLIHYAKSGDLRTAHVLLDKMVEKNSVPWNALLSGYVKKGLEEMGLNVYYEMRRSGILPDQYTFASIFKAYASLATLELGKQAHGVMIKCNVKGNIVVNSALLDMYLKGSNLSDAQLVFDTSPDKNVITWTSLISGYGLHGRFNEVLEYFSRMKSEGFRPNYVTFLSVLSACSHGGFVNEAWEYFCSMKRDYETEPRAQHYAAMVDLLCRAGRVNEAYLFVLSSPCKNHSVIWGSLLEACKIHGEMELAKLAAKKYSELEPENAGKYVVLSNAYAAFELWDDVAEVRSAMRESGMMKEPAYSRIEIQKEINFFYKHDQSHKRSEEIYEMIKEIARVSKDIGYVSDLNGC